MPDLESTIVVLLLWAVIGYLAGSVSGGMILARVMNLGNLREIGSGNIGATNVLRTGNKKAAALTLLFDAGKGARLPGRKYLRPRDRKEDQSSPPQSHSSAASRGGVL